MLFEQDEFLHGMQITAGCAGKIKAGGKATRIKRNRMAASGIDAITQGLHEAAGDVKDFNPGASG